MSSGSTFWLVSELQTAADAFATAAGTDPISAALVVLGALITAGASAAFGAIVFGALLDTVGDAVSRAPPRQHGKPGE